MHDDDGNYADGADISPEDVEQRKKRIALKSVIKKHLLDNGKMLYTSESNDKTMDATTDKLYADWKQHEIQQKAEAAGYAIGGHILHLYSIGISNININILFLNRSYNAAPLCIQTSYILE